MRILTHILGLVQSRSSVCIGRILCTVRSARLLSPLVLFGGFIGSRREAYYDWSNANTLFVRLLCKSCAWKSTRWSRKYNTRGKRAFPKYQRTLACTFRVSNNQFSVSVNKQGQIKWNDLSMANFILSYCFPFGRPEGSLKATLSLLERVLMKDIVTPVPPEEVRSMIKKSLETAALVNYTRLSSEAKIEGNLYIKVIRWTKINERTFDLQMIYEVKWLCHQLRNSKIWSTWRSCALICCNKMKSTTLRYILFVKYKLYESVRKRFRVYIEILLGKRVPMHSQMNFSSHRIIRLFVRFLRSSVVFLLPIYVAMEVHTV